MFPSTKHETKSVPPEIDARWTFFLIFLYTYSNPSFDKGDPVEHIVFSFFKSKLFEILLFFKASIYFALTPKSVIFSLLTIFNSKSFC